MSSEGRGVCIDRDWTLDASPDAFCHLSVLIRLKLADVGSWVTEAEHVGRGQLDEAQVLVEATATPRSRMWSSAPRITALFSPHG